MYDLYVAFRIPNWKRVLVLQAWQDWSRTEMGSWQIDCIHISSRYKSLFLAYLKYKNLVY